MWREFIPVELKNYFNLINNKRRFPGRTILSHAINKEVALGRPCGIYKNVVLEKKVEIGAYSYINAGTRIGENVKIGKYCSIAYNCQIGMNEHPISFVSTSPHTFGKENIFKEQISWEDFNKKVLIGNDVWIGGNTVIMQGVNIGNGAIIAAGAVVTKDVQPYSIVAGVPAKEIKKRFGDEKVSYLQNLKWWDMSENELQQYKDIFTAGEEWAEHLD